MRIEAWRVHDSGLVAAPGPFRRLAGAVRHHRGHGEPWPPRVVLEQREGVLHVTGDDGRAIGTWPLDDVRARTVSTGPPVTFVVEVPGAAHLLAAAAGPTADALLESLRD